MVDRENMDFSNQPTLVFSFWYSPYSSRPPPLPTSMNCCFSAADRRRSGIPAIAFVIAWMNSS